MREDFWSFQPTHKIVLLTNHKPKIEGTDEDIWRRLRLVPFVATFWDPSDPGKDPAKLPSNRKQDKQIGEKLRNERQGILAWLVRGCCDWLGDGLPLPDKVRVATNVCWAHCPKLVTLAVLAAVTVLPSTSLICTLMA